MKQDAVMSAWLYLGLGRQSEDVSATISSVLPSRGGKMKVFYSKARRTRRSGREHMASREANTEISNKIDLLGAWQTAR